MELENMPLPELERLEESVADELRSRRNLEAIPERVAQMNAQYQQAQEDAAAVPFDPVPHFGHGPGTTVTWDDAEWKNVSGAWLTVSPADYPLGWSQQTGLPEDVPKFRAGLDVQPGDLLDYNGTVFRVIQAHTTADHWLPPDLPALYVAQG